MKTKKPTIEQVSYVPRSTKALLLLATKPYRKKTFCFLLFTTLGILAWSASPVVIATIVTQLSDTKIVSDGIWWLVGIYAVLRFIDELFWRLAEFLMRSYKPQMIEGIRTNLFAAALKRPYAFFVNSSSGRIGHWINQAVTTTNEFADTTFWTVWPRMVALVISAFFLLLAHWSLALIFVVWLVALFWYNLHRGKEFGRLVALQSDETSKASGMVVDSMSNHLSVRVFGAATREKTCWSSSRNGLFMSGSVRGGRTSLRMS